MKLTFKDFSVFSKKLKIYLLITSVLNFIYCLHYVNLYFVFTVILAETAFTVLSCFNSEIYNKFKYILSVISFAFLVLCFDIVFATEVWVKCFIIVLIGVLACFVCQLVAKRKVSINCLYLVGIGIFVCVSFAISHYSAFYLRQLSLIFQIMMFVGYLFAKDEVNNTEILKNRTANVTKRIEKIKEQNGFISTSSKTRIKNAILILSGIIGIINAILAFRYKSFVNDLIPVILTVSTIVLAILLVFNKIKPSKYAISIFAILICVLTFVNERFNFMNLFENDVISVLRFIFLIFGAVCIIYGMLENNQTVTMVPVYLSIGSGLYCIVADISLQSGLFALLSQGQVSVKEFLAGVDFDHIINIISMILLCIAVCLTYKLTAKQKNQEEKKQQIAEELLTALKENYEANEIDKIVYDEEKDEIIKEFLI